MRVYRCLQITVNLLSLTKDALDAFIFSGTMRPASVAAILTADAALLVIPPAATNAVQILNQTEACSQGSATAIQCFASASPIHDYALNEILHAVPDFPHLNGDGGVPWFDPLTLGFIT